MNFAVEGRVPAFRENTVESFLQAAAAGATFVEFDVQVSGAPIPSQSAWGAYNSQLESLLHLGPVLSVLPGSRDSRATPCTIRVTRAAPLWVHLPGFRCRPGTPSRSSARRLATVLTGDQGRRAGAVAR